MYRGEAKAIGIHGSVLDCDAGGVSGWRRRSSGITGSGPVTTARGWIFVRVNQVLVRLWTYLLALSDRMLMASSERGDRSEATVVC
jgi:hypothetical protein